jgi:hypothetical protein
VDEETNMVKDFLGSGHYDPVSEIDYQVALMTVRNRFFVGLTDEMEVSIHQFNVILRINNEYERIDCKCMGRFIGHRELKSNANPHPKICQILAGK